MIAQLLKSTQAIQGEQHVLSKSISPLHTFSQSSSMVIPVSFCSYSNLEFAFATKRFRSTTTSTPIPHWSSWAADKRGVYLAPKPPFTQENPAPTAIPTRSQYRNCQTKKEHWFSRIFCFNQSKRIERSPSIRQPKRYLVRYGLSELNQTDNSYSLHRGITEELGLHEIPWTTNRLTLTQRFPEDIRNYPISVCATLTESKVEEITWEDVPNYQMSDSINPVDYLEKQLPACPPRTVEECIAVNWRPLIMTGSLFTLANFVLLAMSWCQLEALRLNDFLSLRKDRRDHQWWMINHLM